MSNDDREPEGGILRRRVSTRAHWAWFALGLALIVSSSAFDGVATHSFEFLVPGVLLSSMPELMFGRNPRVSATRELFGRLLGIGTVALLLWLAVTSMDEGALATSSTILNLLGLACFFLSGMVIPESRVSVATSGPTRPTRPEPPPYPEPGGLGMFDAPRR